MVPALPYLIDFVRLTAALPSLARNSSDFQHASTFMAVKDLPAPCFSTNGLGHSSITF